MAREGMDTGTIGTIVGQLDSLGGTQIPSIISHVDQIISNINANWTGPDATAFEQSWNSTLRPDLTAVQTAVQTLHTQASKNLAEQQAASNSTGA